jgi:hypothetical protein
LDACRNVESPPVASTTRSLPGLSSSSGLSAEDRTRVPTVPTFNHPQPSAGDDPVLSTPGGNKNQTKRDYSRWYDQYEIDKPATNIAD